MDHAETHVMARLTAATPRRVIAVGILFLLAAMLVWIAGTTPADLIWKFVLFAVGLVTGWAALAMWQATGVNLLLTKDGIVQSNGRVVVAMDQIVDVDRGVFAWKPSNGFSVRLASRHSVAWAPGLWWRYGRRLGVGGVTGAGAAKAMADILAMHLADPR
ncbi:hypothetical protein PARPLA_02509 [Rhodobacteraceae bacterium THAF1]|nr:hypothetical protein FIU81_04820 [Palleronia sp. THAF1]VDC27840.1 hypothetical protein PARPLA_02509 [Rhodobacteraceae bacterium THAF1]